MDIEEEERIKTLQHRVKLLTLKINKQNRKIGEMRRVNDDLKDKLKISKDEKGMLEVVNEDMRIEFEKLQEERDKENELIWEKVLNTKEDEPVKPEMFRTPKKETKLKLDRQRFRTSVEEGMSGQKRYRIVFKGLKKVKTVIPTEKQSESTLLDLPLKNDKKVIKKDKPVLKTDKTKVKDKKKAEEVVKYDQRDEFRLPIIDILRMGIDIKKLESYLTRNKYIFELSSLINKKQNEKFNEEIVKFFASFPVKPKLVTIENNMDKLNKFLLSENSANEFFCISLNSDNIIEEFKNVPVCLRESNSYLFYQHYCISTTDFTITKDFKRNVFNVILIPKIYIIKTFYPFSLLFREILNQYVHSLRRHKMETFLKCIKDKQVDLDHISQIDYSGVKDKEIDLAFELKNALNTFDLTKEDFRKIFASTDNFVINFKLPQRGHLPLLEVESFFKRIFSRLSFEDFLMIYAGTIHEKHILFISESVSQTTAAITSFLTLFKPFKWPLPVIFNVPEDLLQILSSPIPVMAGININSKRFLETVYSKYQSPNWIYVFLDENFVFANKNLIKQLHLPQFNGFILKTKGFYEKWFNKDKSAHIKLKYQSEKTSGHYKLRLATKNGLKSIIGKIKDVGIDKRERSIASTVFDPDIEESLGIFRMFTEMHCSFIIENLSKDKSINENTKELSSYLTNTGDKQFLTSFSQKQSFFYFFENLM